MNLLYIAGLLTLALGGSGRLSEKDDRGQPRKDDRDKDDRREPPAPDRR
jgi:hypothetical protein